MAEKLPTAEADFIVELPLNDPRRPLNWPFKKKAIHTGFYGLTTFAAQYNSAAMSSVTLGLQDAFGVDRTVAVLSTALYIFGVAFGPMIFAPFSEVYGRKVGVILPFAVSGIFTLGTAASKDIAAILCTRFFAGLFAAAPIVSSGGVMADLYLPAQRGQALVYYSYFIVGGTTVAPIVSSLLLEHGDWQWSCWFTAIIYGVVLSFDVLLLQETYVPVLNSRLARDMRFNSKDWRYHSKHEEWQLTVREFFQVHFARPFAMLATPIVLLITLFASYVFGILYLTVTSIAETFQTVHKFGSVESQLPLLGLWLGLCTGGVANILGSKRYSRLVKAAGHSLPEERFVPMMFMGWLMPAGIFMFAWTNDEKIHWFVPIIGIYLMGCGFLTIFQGCLNYLVDAFTRYSASAVAAATFTRSIFGGVFSLIGVKVWQNLGVHWGGSMIAFIALGMIPIPFVFYVFGERIRAKNPYINLVT